MVNSPKNEKVTMSRCKETKKYLPATVAWTLLLSTTALFFIFPAQWFWEHYSPWIPIGEAFVALIVIANFTLATFMDPGIIPKATRGEDDNDDLRAPLYKTVEVHGITVRMKWCITCQFYRPPRCSHCSVCNHCIETFDHHCPWVNNCIGRRNYRFFFMFLMSLSIHMISIFSLCLIHVLHHMEKNLSELPTIISVSIMIVISILFIPIIGLTGFHIILVSRGRTTNEQVTGKYRGGYNPFSRGCCYNCWFTLCGPQYPGLVKAKKIACSNVAVLYQPSSGGPPTGQGTTGGPGNQVKVYVDNGNYSGNKVGNLPSLHSPRNYRQMVPVGRDDPDFSLQASQSLDCEPTPPMQRHGSKTNFFLPPNGPDDSPANSHLRHIRGQFTHGSPHPNRQRSGEARSRSQTPDSVSSPSEAVGVEGNVGSPTIQKIRAIGGIPTPFTVTGSPVTHRSNPPTPTQGTRPEYMGFVQSGPAQPPPYYDPYPGVNGDQRRFLSEGELLLERDFLGPPRDASGQIRELASSPQRGVYHWKESSPTGAPNSFMASYFYSNPTSPIQHSILNNSGMNNRGYFHPGFHNSPPAGYVGVPKPGPVPLSPNTKKKMFGTGGGEVVRPSHVNRRPMSFVRALEMTDSLEMNNRNPVSRNSPAGTPKANAQISVNETADRASVYDMNYEISV